MSIDIDILGAVVKGRQEKGRMTKGRLRQKVDRAVNRQKGDEKWSIGLDGKVSASFKAYQTLSQPG